MQPYDVYLIFQTKIIGSNKIHSLKYLRFTTLRCKDIGIIKSEFVAKTQFLYHDYDLFVNVTNRSKHQKHYWTLDIVATSLEAAYLFGVLFWFT